MRVLLTAVLSLLTASTLLADPLRCDLAQYKGSAGLTASVEQDLLVVSWAGQSGELRARFAIDGAQPVIRELAIRKPGGQWAILGQNLTPEIHVTSGVRRMSNQQAQPLRQLGIEITPEVIEKEKWFVFWDAPLVIPGIREGQQAGPPQGGQARNIGLPRKPEEIRRATSSFNTTSCEVKTDGGRIEVTFPGLSMGIFAGSLRYTAYRGTNLLRMEAVAKTDEPSVAYKYHAGLKGFSTDHTPRVTWRDVGGYPQQYLFGGAKNETPVPVKARNRVLIAEGKGGSVATFPPPHTFFWAREVETNLGYVWYRKDADRQFTIGVRQGDGEEVQQYVENFALYNAPPGTWQRMAVYFYASPEAAEPTRRAALAYTHGDTYKAIPGYKTFVNHFHIRFTERLRAAGSLDAQTPDLVAMKAIGVNIAGLSDFHGDLRGQDPGDGRFADQKDYAEGSRKASDQDFLVTPWEEPSAYFGGHTNHMFPKNVYWTKVRQQGQPFTENHPVYGKVYHTGSAADVQQLLDAENGYWFHAHPRTKGTTGYPDSIFDKPWIKNDRYLGIAFKPGMGMDLSEKRLCEYRCFDAIDTMNNLYAGSGLQPKLLIADIDTYRKGPEDDLYPSFPMNYVKLGRVPGPDEDWSPILKSLRNGDFFVSTGEILIKGYGVEGTGNQRTIVADMEWTFPLEFMEIVWGDGKKVDRKIISATDLGPLGSKRVSFPFDATGKKWVRFAVWDSAGNGAFVQPVWLDAARTTTTASR
jgi:hypothetical protein